MEVGMGVGVAENKRKPTVPGPCFSQTPPSGKCRQPLPQVIDKFTPKINPYQDAAVGFKVQPFWSSSVRSEGSRRYGGVGHTQSLGLRAIRK